VNAIAYPRWRRDPHNQNYALRSLKMGFALESTVYPLELNRCQSERTVLFKHRRSFNSDENMGTRVKALYEEVY
jgi:hypothetical protein